MYIHVLVHVHVCTCMYIIMYYTHACIHYVFLTSSSHALSNRSEFDLNVMTHLPPYEREIDKY